ncbi:helix-turn-helix domain-containing protein [Taylorella equigenitalis]|uniref:helix-turn-helix domain-containing protein n=1 Tax=Taylorella equigenitalis TaxID=29575 RepID=UPI00237C81EB|nr:helix-turn-helix domain-containing protein [Taylorella equigenitalis]WDU53550.1 Fis family transcriptional regulator [Taylorella equigenitalis]
MRETLDCAVLYTDHFKAQATSLVNLTDKTKRVQFKEFNLGDLTNSNLPSYVVNDYELPHPNTLRELGPLLHRYDVVILPVNQKVLIWLRVMLSNCPDFPTPVMILCDDVHPTALPDLAKLGVVDFISFEDSTPIIMARIKSAIERYSYFRQREIISINRLMAEVDDQNREPKYTSASIREGLAARKNALKELEYTESVGSYTLYNFSDSSSSLNYEKSLIGQPSSIETRKISFVPPFSHLELDDADVKPPLRKSPKRKIITANITTVQSTPSEQESIKDDDSFKDAKDKIVSAFEKEFIINALIQSKGNIAQAAKRSGKNRRSFWELMRKHEISAKQFRH